MCLTQVPNSISFTVGSSFPNDSKNHNRSKGGGRWKRKAKSHDSKAKQGNSRSQGSHTRRCCNCGSNHHKKCRFECLVCYPCKKEGHFMIGCLSILQLQPRITTLVGFTQYPLLRPMQVGVSYGRVQFEFKFLY